MVKWLLVDRDVGRLEQSRYRSSSSLLRRVAGIFPRRLISSRTSFATSRNDCSAMFGMMMLASNSDNAAKKVISRSENRNVSTRSQIMTVHINED